MGCDGCPELEKGAENSSDWRPEAGQYKQRRKYLKAPYGCRGVAGNGKLNEKARQGEAQQQEPRPGPATCEGGEQALQTDTSYHVTSDRLPAKYSKGLL